MFFYRTFLDGGQSTTLEDIVRNLRWIFSSRKGSGYFLETFGVSDIGFRTPEEMIVTLTSEIKENVRLYEPRVEVIDVDEDWDEAGKRTKLTVRMRLRDASEKLAVVVDLKKRAFDVVALTPPRR